MTECSCEAGGCQRSPGERLGHGEVRGEKGQCTPRDGEPKIRVEPAGEQLEVVRDHDEAAERDEGKEPRRPGDCGDDADCDCGCDRRDSERPEDGAWDLRRQRPALEFVERMGADAEREKKRDQRRAEAAWEPYRCERCADDDVAEVPERVRDVEQRYVVTPATRLEGIERGAGLVRQCDAPR